MTSYIVSGSNTHHGIPIFRRSGETICCDIRSAWQRKIDSSAGLAPFLNLPVIDNDDSLERLFETRGTGDAAWRRALSRESDQSFRKEAFQARGAILVSFRHLPGMAPDSGTPTDWLGRLSGHVVNVACVCAPEIAAERCFRRTRHPGHLDGAASKEQVLASIQSLSRLDRLQIGKHIEVDTSTEHVKLDTLAQKILSTLHDLASEANSRFH